MEYVEFRPKIRITTNGCAILLNATGRKQSTTTEHRMSIAQEVKDKLDIVDIISDHVPLKRSGRNLSGFCPFHNNTRTPAFYVNPERQTWRCFGACAEGGDVFSFVMKREGMDFVEALKTLAARANVELPVYRPKSQDQQSIEDRLGNLMETAADYFHELLLSAPEAEAARTYVRSRNLKRRSVTGFKIGFSLNSFDACRSHFEGMGYTNKELLSAGLLTENEEKGTTYDRFRNRLMFPIQDVNGRIVGFGARTLEKDGIPKYLNSPQTPLFDKSKLLYGLSDGKRSIREAREAVIVEGYMDVIRAHEAGFKNVIAQMGTALTETQLQTLKRYTKRFIIALDADEAGVKATMRSLEVARETLDRDVDVSFNARGLIQQEGRLKADIRVAMMPEGQDPDDIISSDPGQWVSLIKESQPIVGYVIDTLTADLDMGNAKAKSAVAEQVIPLIRDVADPIERSHYMQKLSTVLQVDERALQRFAPKKKKRRAAPAKKQPLRSSNPVDEMGPPPDFDFDDLPTEPPGFADLPPDDMVGPDDFEESAPVAAFRRSVAPLVTDPIEANFLRQSIEHPVVMGKVDALLRKAQQPMIEADDFTSTEDQALWKHLRRRSAEASAGKFVSVEEMCDNLDTVLTSRVRSLTIPPASSDVEIDHLTNRLTRSVLNWRLDKVRRTLSEVKHLVTVAKQAGDAESSELHAYRCQELTMMIYSINQARRTLRSNQRN